MSGNPYRSKQDTFLELLSYITLVRTFVEASNKARQQESRAYAARIAFTINVTSVDFMWSIYAHCTSYFYALLWRIEILHHLAQAYPRSYQLQKIPLTTLPQRRIALTILFSVLSSCLPFQLFHSSKYPETFCQANDSETKRGIYIYIFISFIYLSCHVLQGIRPVPQQCSGASEASAMVFTNSWRWGGGRRDGVETERERERAPSIQQKATFLHEIPKSTACPHVNYCN